ncbi:B12-binding domain-containing radical SAM protein [Thetidibacter halocola]|uniref:Radical SAM protein n=1 Tax=Thetidibacter halocola TaxID=2827239 RepID=A0A8J7WHC0_9RHOB|nr:radical SAM protein [Thetidibacter halocola]MBS0126837.1 radical SAM protein [Thetidibacter halocola]
MTRRIALVCLTPEPDTAELGPLKMPSYGIRRIEASVRADPALADADVRLIDMQGRGAAEQQALLAGFDPHLIGFSAYVWSAPDLIALARAHKATNPGTVIVFGGPSARTAFFDLPPYHRAGDYLDAVVEGDGELIFNAIARLDPLTAAGLETVPGLALPRGEGWLRTGPAPRIDLAALASPFRMGLMPPQSVAYLETFRGCPLSCRFCEWGVFKDLKAVFPEEAIVEELRAFERLESPAVFLLDAGLNLNGHAFRNLAAAHAQVPALRDRQFWAEVYPASVKPEHLEFLEGVGTSYLGVGLQSIDTGVLKALDRPQNGARFDPAIRMLAEVAEVEVQIIFGLPGDTPEGFMQTLQYALSLPVDVRAYHCLVLPDALLTRSRAEWTLRFDPRTLAMISNSSWSRDDIAAMRRRLSALVRAHGGHSGEFWYAFKSRAQAGAVRA